MGKTAADTDRDLRRAMAVFKARVLDVKNFDPAIALYRYEGAITESAIMKIAGIKSRGTLLSENHAKLRGDLKSTITELKIKTGKYIPIVVSDDDAPSGETSGSEISRSERLAQTIAALSFRIMVLEREISSLKAGDGARVDNVTSLIGSRHKRERNKNAKI